MRCRRASSPGTSGRTNFRDRGTWTEKQGAFYPDRIDRQHPLRRRSRLRGSHSRARRAQPALERCRAPVFRGRLPRRIARTASSPTGRSPIRSSRPSTAKPSASSASSARAKGWRNCPTVTSTRRRRRSAAPSSLGRKACRRLGIDLIPIRKALLVGQPRGQRMPCHYCRHCMDGCEVGAIATSRQRHPAGCACHWTTHASHERARPAHRGEHARAAPPAWPSSIASPSATPWRRAPSRGPGVRRHRIAAHPAELNAGPRSANGLGNSSDLVGRYLTGHMQLNMHGYLEALEGPRARESGRRHRSLDHPAVQSPPAVTRLRRRLLRAGHVRDARLSASRDARRGIRRDVQVASACAAAGDVPDGRHGEGARAPREPRDRRSVARSTRTAFRSPCCSSRTATTIARCGTTCRRRSRRSFTRQVRRCSSRNRR